MFTGIAGFFAKAAMGAVMGIVTKLISRELFEGIAEKCLVHLLKWESSRTANTLDDAIVTDVINALHQPAPPKKSAA